MKKLLLLIFVIISWQAYSQKIEDLPRATTSTGTDLIIVDQADSTRAIAKDNLYSGDTLDIDYITVDTLDVNYIEVNSRIIIDPDITSSAIKPSLGFGDGNDGFFQFFNNWISITINGLNTFNFDASKFKSATTYGAVLFNEAATSTNPTLSPSRADEVTGLGWAGNDSLSLIAGGIEGIRIAEGDGNIKVTVTDTLQVNGTINGYQTDGITPLYYHEYNISAFETATGASGATLTAPNANTIGGYQLDAVGEQLYYTTHIENDWDGASDVIIEINWEINEATAADGTVDLKLICYYKGNHEATNKTQTVEVAHPITGNKAQYTQHLTTFVINWDEAENVIEINDIFGFILNLETDTSECDDIIVNYVEIKYQTTKPALETY